MKRGVSSRQLERVTIVGGGLAGLTLGILLRREGVPVDMWEAGRYPRHRVCGEFVSGRGRHVLQSLGLEDRFLEHGARIATTASFHSTSHSGPPANLPEPALCLSRHTMDAVLVREFTALGGELHLGQRWQGDPASVGVVSACGRRATATLEGWRWFGLKAHAVGLQLDADLEMHLGENGYVGLCRLADDRVNVCGLFRSRPNEPDARSWRERLTGPPGTPLHTRLAGAAFDEESMSAVAGLDLASAPDFSPAECRIGDALAMIPPVTGNGMSMAFESARIAADPLLDWSLGTRSWAETNSVVARDLEGSFSARLRIARWLQRGLFVAAFQEPLVRLISGQGRGFKTLFRLTR
jgi:menaquinone-9 beta-reductase